jgi:hypothetical protein
MTIDRRRIALEGLVIVFSILLAFTIDRAWDRHTERKSEARLIQSIANDITNTRAVVARQLALSERVAITGHALLRALAGESSKTVRDSLLRHIGHVLVTRTWSPVNDSYAEALGSGRLNLIRNDSLRLALARYQVAIARVDEQRAAIQQQYYAEGEPFLIAHTVWTDVAPEFWPDSLPQAARRTDLDALAARPELWNLLALRLENEASLRARLQGVDSFGAEVLKQIQ